MDEAATNTPQCNIVNCCICNPALRPSFCQSSNRPVGLIVVTDAMIHDVLANIRDTLKQSADLQVETIRQLRRLNGDHTA